MAESCLADSGLFGRSFAPLYERFRPSTWADVVGQEKVVNRVLAMRKRGGLSGRAYWLSGQSGTGKTTIARLIAQDVADSFLIHEVDASALTISQLKDLETESQFRGCFGDKAGRAFIVNEAHGLRKDVIRQLLVMLERIPPHVVWIFTTTIEGQESLFEDYQDASPLLSRCLRLDLARRDLARAFAERAKQIAQAEGLDGKPIEQYVRLVQTHRQNFRAVLQAIEAGEMAG
jgi:DNA polymerase III gamma/tau subunit